MLKITIHLLAFFLAVPFMAKSQIHHWETLVSDNSNWRYQIPNANTPTQWYDTSFDASNWPIGQGGFGFGDNDDNTVIPTNVTSVYFLQKFNVADLQSIEKLLLAVDYDDGFIAYLNGQLLVSRNVNLNAQPLWNSLATASHEAVLYSGGQPDKFYFSKAELTNLLHTGMNTLNVAVFNNTPNSNDLSGRCFLLAGISDTVQTYANPPAWFSPPLELFKTNLPIVVVNTQFEAIPDEPKIDATMGIIHNDQGDTNSIHDPFNEYFGQITIERRGSSSNNFP
ncbi:MAG: hypothetical protein EBU82_13635, partial [Flavobacteriia bacterium]|nr:hypothetical protein [Flavobacteriia bacterium]